MLAILMIYDIFWLLPQLFLGSDNAFVGLSFANINITSQWNQIAGLKSQPKGEF